MRAMPDQFRCDACHARQPDEWLCLGTFRGPLPWGARPPLRCVACCACPEHPADDPGGTVVWPWSGLAGSPPAC